MATKQYSISLITNGQATTLKFNKPIRLIQAALNDISARLDGLHNKSAVMQWDVTVSSDAALGDLVYFDSLNGSCFRPAIARLAAVPGTQGQSVLAPSSRVLGLLLSRNPAVILRAGYYLSSIINATIGIGALAGLYYLSPSTAGKATKEPGWNMRQPCISYYGAGKFSMITNYLAHDNHHHTYTKVSQRIPASAYTGSDSIQGTYVWLVNTALTGLLSSLNSVVFYKGQLADTSIFKTGKSTVWYNGAGVPLDTIYVFNVFPFAYGDSVVRSIGTNTLKINASRGAVQIDMPAYTKAAAYKSPTAISNIVESTLLITPVVSKLTAGAGIYTAHVGAGLYVVASSKDLNVPIKALLMYMNGAQRVATSLLTYTVFPKGIDSSITMSMPVLNNTAIPLKVYVWAQTKTNSIGAFTVSFYFIPLTQGYSVVPIPTTPMYDTVTLSTRQSSTTGLLYCLVPVSSEQISSDISTSGTLVAKLEISRPSDDVYVYQTGFRLLAKPTLLSQSTALHTLAELLAAILDNLTRVLTFNASY